MRRLLSALIGVFALGAIAGCSTGTPEPPATVAAVPAVEAKPAGLPYRWTHGHSAKSYQAMLADFGKAGLTPGQFVWADEIPAEGDIRVIVDLMTQMAYVWRGDRLIGASTISSGKRGKETPLGLWSVLQKKKMHHSRKYDDAPMPFMQRIDEYGIALHGGKLPGYPASHGCVRLPMKFAEKLYGLTKIGSEVIVEG